MNFGTAMAPMIVSCDGLQVGSRFAADFLFFDIVLRSRGRPLTRGRGLKRLEPATSLGPVVARSHAGAD